MAGIEQKPSDLDMVRILVVDEKGLSFESQPRKTYESYDPNSLNAKNLVMNSWKNVVEMSICRRRIKSHMASEV